jgi:hypothetical protein
MYFYRIGKCRAMKNTTLWNTLDPKRGKENYMIFTMLFDDMQENISIT